MMITSKQDPERYYNILFWLFCAHMPKSMMKIQFNFENKQKSNMIKNDMINF